MAKTSAKKSSKPNRRTRRGLANRGADEGLRIWGIHACREAIINPKRRVRSIATQGPSPDWLATTLARADGFSLSRPQPDQLDRTDFAALVPEQAVHQGIVMAVDPLAGPSLDELIETTADASHGLLVVLDQVVDPHNVGAIIRSATAFGALAVIVQDRHSPPLTGTLFKAASGGCEHVPIVPVANIARALRKLSESGVMSVGLAESADISLDQFEPPAGCAIVMGGEGAGLRRLVAESCDILASLPTFGAISTLNVSNAAAVALYHVSGRQRFGNR